MMPEQIEFILRLQSLFTPGVGVMKFFSFLGSEEFYLSVIPMLYWCIDSRLAIRTIIFLLIGDSIKAILKMAFHLPRPFWVDSRVKAFVYESDFGMPSGHSLNAAVVFGNFAASTRKPVLKVGFVLVVILIGFSRIILGVHFPADVLLGWFTGALLLFSFITLEPKIVSWFKQRSYATWIFLAFAFSIFLITTGWLVKYALSGWVIPAQWITNSASQFPSIEPENSIRISGLVSNAGVLFGLVSGLALINTRGGFSTEGHLWKKILRFLIGIAVVIVIWSGLGALFPRGDYFLAYIFRYARYFLIGLWVAGIAPYLFVILRLAEKKSGSY